MKISDIEEYFDLIYPEKISFDWDNSGLLLSLDKEREVRRILTCLDVTAEAIDKAKEIGAELIVSHHPMIFEPVKKISEETSLGRKIISLFDSKISLISLHTRFDFAPFGLNFKIAEMLGIELFSGVFPENEPYTKIIGKFQNSFSPEDLAKHISTILKTPVKLFSADINIEKVAICCGGGKDYFSFAKENGVDAFITGDVSHHVAVDALEEGISIIDFGHFGSEKIATEILKQRIEERFPYIDVFPFYQDFQGKYFDENC